RRDRRQLAGSEVVSHVPAIAFSLPQLRSPIRPKLRNAMSSRILASLLAAATAVSLSVVRTRAQSAIEPPGARRPDPPSKPRIAPLPEGQWTDTHRQLVAK